MRATITESYNYLLFLCGIRRTLPAYFINHVPVVECGEGLVTWRGACIRKHVADMLNLAERALPAGFTIVVLEGWRSQETQSRRRNALLKRLSMEYPERPSEERELQADRCVARISGHLTGGAVDVTLAQDGVPLDCGTAYLAFNERTITSCNHLTPIQRVNRRMLFMAMTKAGFVNFPLEWWHYCYGDKMYAAYRRLPHAIYGDVSGCSDY